MSDIKKLSRLYDRNKANILENYFQFLRFKSISSEIEHQKDSANCASWLKDYLKQAGLAVEVFESPSGNPIILASWSGAGPDKPTVMIYNHYDVQPVDPLELWTSPPFEPTIRDNKVYARGAQDNKGQCHYVISAIKYLLEEQGTLPVNIKLCIEGEEECGSGFLSEILKKQTSASFFSSDYLLIVDLGYHKEDVPAISLGVRGLCALTVEFKGANIDLHSGSHGGIVYNPNHALVEVLAKLRDDMGRITVPGFYDDVVDVSSSELENIDMYFDQDEYFANFGVRPNGGEKSYKFLESAWLRPTLEINGITGGYTGDGFKTVIPATSKAKISCRLVPNQQPEIIARRLSEFIQKITPDEIKVTITEHKGGASVRTSANSVISRTASRAYSEVFSKPCGYVYEGGSIPIVSELASKSKAEVVLMGFGLPSDMIHAPNEHFGLDRLEKGFITIARILQILGST
jgi:acetylornithine deacetylase/succinyl-diaminopimelate desuccinylase-like protein